MSPQREVAQIISSIRVFSELHYSDRERFGMLLVERLWLLQDKLSASPFTMKSDSFGINTDFSHGISRWLDHLDESARAGALLLVAGISYLPRREIDSFLAICCDHFGHRLSRSIRSPSLVRVLQLTSGTDIHSDFAHKVGVSNWATPHKTQAPTAESYMRHHLSWLRQMADGYTVDHEYYKIDKEIKAMVEEYPVFIEDWSLSGQNVVAALTRMLSLRHCLFGAPTTMTLLRDRRVQLPPITVVLPVVTSDALLRIDKVIQQFRAIDDGVWSNVDLILGHVFDDSIRLNHAPASPYDCITSPAPSWLSYLTDRVPSLAWAPHVISALQWYSSVAGESVKQLMEAARFPASASVVEFAKYGFRGNGILLLGYKNCPNNAPTMLWHSFSSDSCKYDAPFPRVESGHTSIDQDADDWLDDVERGMLKLAPRVIACLREITAW